MYPLENPFNLEYAAEAVDSAPLPGEFLIFSPKWNEEKMK